jgi:hypothetical protein
MINIKRFKDISEFPDKERLDILTKKEIGDLRTNILSVNDFTVDMKRYVDELGFYTDVRFKQDRIDQLNMWGRKAKENPHGDERVVGDIINRMGVEEFYKWDMETELEKHGEFRYIKGVELNLN